MLGQPEAATALPLIPREVRKVGRMLLSYENTHDSRGSK